ncbi:hypothetical protein H8M03_12220 [Sphingomonas sabuli]|uniref:Uncharacterized protein n=1 Tax=Sphingomonas sabuli TaxID=2764186 RepID=A0A7G9L287_9SPHN|nr:DUF6694 family lipoprotein [Sphingomonas sabuli]QNM82736.1 hypothetical protein H8M03_12220 [Sphingomonas sabuli]
MRVAVLLACALAGCGSNEPTVIDGSSAQAFEASVSRAREDLPDGDRMTFDRAIRTVGGRWMGNPDPDKAARVTFNGMTAAEIVADQEARETGG